MKEILAGLAVGLLLTATGQAQLVSFNPDSPALSGVTATFPDTSSNANVVVTDLTRGSGLTGTSASGGFSSSSWNDGTTLATAMSSGNYLTFTITPAANYSLSFTNITGNFVSSGTGATNGQWAIGSTGVGSSGAIPTSGSSAISATLTNTGVTTATEFRFAGWGASAAGGTTRIEQTVSLAGTATLRSAGTLTWDGGQANGNWNSYTGTAANQSNWNLNNLPTSSLVDSLNFAGSTQTATSNNITGLTVGSISFASGASAFTNGGNSLTLNSGITNSSSNTQTINHAMVLSSGSHTMDAASGNLVVGGALSGAGASLIKAGANTLTLSGTNSYGGGTTINAGTLSAGNNSALGTGSVTVNTGGILLIQSGFNLTNTVNIAGGSYQKNIATGTNYNYSATSSFAGGQADTGAQLVAGTTGGTRTLDTSFTAISTAGNDEIRSSDVFNLSGTGGDAFTLQLQVTGISADSILGWNNAGTWVNAVDGNIGSAGSLAGAYAMSWSDFLLSNGAFDGATMLGAYGYDIAGNTVWAVIDHNSEFASIAVAIPEPSAYVLLGLGLGSLWILRRKKKVS